MTLPIAKIEMEDGSIVEIEFYPEIAPNTVNNFIDLANHGFYDGLIFHRVIPGFMVQGGDPKGSGTGGPGYSIAGEFADNNFANNLIHSRGVISMARAMDPNSAGSQFFIIVENSPNLDGQYSAFGKVINGIEAIDKIVAVQRDGQDKPQEPQIMKRVFVDTFDVEYGEPKRI